MFEYALTAESRGLLVIIAAAGGAAHLPGMIAAKTLVPVLGVPVAATILNGVDALLSIVQMPAGIPVATVSIGGARNAGILAVRMLGASDRALAAQLADYADELKAMVADKNAALQEAALQQNVAPDSR
jgi:5-(carboxyamino)imidazole ribonucleotide mutase